MVDRKFERRLAGLINSGERGVLRGGTQGRREGVAARDAARARSSQTRHPAALGAPLTNEHITTDFSESLIELVTPPFGETWELLQYLCDIHQFVYRHLDDELLWSTSMPCAIGGDESIPLAQFGRSNVGRMKTVYRHGLGVRYGRIMQAISGVHFNYSFSADFWDALEDINQSNRPRQDFVSDAIFRGACATTAASAGWCCTCSAPRPRCPRASLRSARSSLPVARRRYGVRAVRNLAAHERHRLSKQELRRR